MFQFKTICIINHIENICPIIVLKNLFKAQVITVYEPIFKLISNLLIEKQDGFIRNWSTVLFCITQFIANSFDKLPQMALLYVNFSKAFNKLDYTFLRKNFSTFGFDSNFCKYYCCYLEHRSQFDYKSYNSCNYFRCVLRIHSRTVILLYLHK